MGLSTESRVRQAERVAARSVEGKAVVVVIDAHKLHVMNPVGSRVWDLADGRTVRDIVAAIIHEFAVEPEVAERDVLKFLDELASIGALEVEGDASVLTNSGGNS